ncbi:MAG TPA: BON domain-containing protein [Blastocatellia bacterium]|nr:BON domain-containing protein [Blastocatellia bacterium]
MGKTSLRAALLAALCVLMAMSALACKSGPDDAALTTSVKAKIAADAGLKTAKIDVATKDGVVTLSGTADTDAEKTSAATIAKGVEGVKSVTNNITVKPPAPVAPVVDTSNDAAIKKAITDAITAAGVKGVEVEVVGGVATLKGSVAKGSMTKAVMAANEAKPKPTKVQNQLTEK